ncbi:MAG: DNA translocase FtsK [Acidaminococcales bacterium]|nr:DNA translocase FtsK [Acidaminococcales bacterium]
MAIKVEYQQAEVSDNSEVIRLSNRQVKAEGMLKNEIYGVLSIGAAILCSFSIAGVGLGVLGGLIAKALAYALGRGAFLLPALLLGSGVKHILRPEGKLCTRESLAVSGFFLDLLVIFHHWAAPAGSELMPEYLLSGGGAASGLVLFLCRKALGLAGTWVLLVAAALCLAILAFKLSLKKVAVNTGKTVGAAAAVMTNPGKRARKDSFFDYEDVLSKDVFSQAEGKSARKEPTGTVGAEVAGEPDDIYKAERPESPAPLLEADAGRDAPDGRAERAEMEMGQSAPISQCPAEAENGAMVFALDLGDPADAPTINAAGGGEKAAPADGIFAAADGGESFYKFPHLGLLQHTESAGGKNFAEESDKQAAVLEQTLADFKVAAKIVNIVTGPSVTRFELEPAPGVKVSRITSLTDDLTLRLAVSGIRIETSVPGKSVMGIEVPRATADPVLFYDVVASGEFKNAHSRLAMALGKDIAGRTVVADIGKMPHLLVAGSTGSGKSVCINTIINSILFKASPTEVKFIMIDPKVVELNTYNGIPHLLTPVVTNAKKAASALCWAVEEMERRYGLFAETGARQISGYNDISAEKLPYIVVIIDELADLMMAAPSDVENAICRLAQKARAAGLHLILATQRPSVDVITGIIKANIPSRIAFAVSSQIDSRTILDAGGAEKLLGRGDMLYYPSGAGKPLRLQGAFISDREIENIVSCIKEQSIPVEYSDDVTEFSLPSDKAADSPLRYQDNMGAQDELLKEAVDLVMQTGQASASLLQRRLRIGYARAGRLVDIMEEMGIAGPATGNSKPRDLLMTHEEAIRAIGACGGDADK